MVHLRRVRGWSEKRAGFLLVLMGIAVLITTAVVALMILKSIDFLR